MTALARNLAQPIELFGEEITIGDAVISRQSLLSWSPGDLAEADIHPIVEPEPTPYGFEAVGSELVVVNGQVVRQPILQPIDLSTLKLQRLEDLAIQRKEAVKTFTFAGQPLRLDTQTEDAISKAKAGLERNPTSVIDWEISRGVFVTFDLATILALADAAFAHVQACFSRVRVLTGEIQDATTAAELNAIDLTSGWPQAT